MFPLNYHNKQTDFDIQVKMERFGLLTHNLLTVYIFHTGKLLT